MSSTIVPVSQEDNSFVRGYSTKEQIAFDTNKLARIKMRKKYHEERRALIVLIILELFDASYDMAVYLNFINDAIRSSSNEVYADLYTAVTCLAMLATLQLLYTQVRSVQQISNELKATNNSNLNSLNEGRTASLKAKRKDIVRSAQVGEGQGMFLEQRLGIAERQIRRIKSFVVCAILEDGFNAALLCYRMIFLGPSNIGMDGTADDGFINVHFVDMMALTVGCFLIGFKTSYIRDLFRSKQIVKEITEQLVREAQACSSILDTFLNVKMDEVNTVVAVRCLMANEIRNEPAHVVGDVNLLWIVRNCKYNIHKACERLRAILKFRKAQGSDEVLKNMLIQNPRHFDPDSSDWDTTRMLGVCEQSNHLVMHTVLRVLFSKNQKQIEDWYKHKSEFEMIVRHYLSKKKGLMVGTIIITDANNAGLKIGQIAQYQANARTLDECLRGFGGHDPLQTTIYTGMNDSAMTVYNTISKLIPNSLVLGRSIGYGKDETELYQRIPLAKKYRQEDDFWNPSILEVAGQHLILTLLDDVTQAEIDLVEQVENEMPEAAEMLDPFAILNFLRISDLNKEKALGALEKVLKWRKQNNAHEVKTALKQQLTASQISITSPPPTIAKLRQLMAIQWLGPSKVGQAILITLKDQDINGLAAVGMEMVTKMYIEDQLMTELSLNQISMDEKRMVRMSIIYDARGSSSKLHKLIPYILLQGKMESHFPERAAKPIIVYGWPQKLIYVYETLVKPFLSSKLADKIVLVPADQKGIQQLSQHFDLTVFPRTFFNEANEGTMSDLPIQAQ